MTCTRPGCDKPTRAADLCEAHYRAAARTGHCTIDDCTAPIYARLRCARHYEQWRGANAVKPRCAVDGCDRPRRARDWCEMHYRRWRTTGATDLPAAPAAKARPKPKPTAKARPKPKPTVKRAKKPKSTLPDGWFKPSPKSSEKGNTLTQERVDTLLPLVSVSEAEAAQYRHRMRLLLAHNGLLDELADVLGVA